MPTEVSIFSLSVLDFLLTCSGIGREILSILLARPNVTVIAANRDLSHPTSNSLKDLPRGQGSKLLLVKLDSNHPEDATAAVKTLQLDHGITRVDVLIANAGIGDYWNYALKTPVQEIERHIKINTFGPIALLQAFWPLLDASEEPKFIVTSTTLGSIGAMEQFPFLGLAYGISKVAANYAIKKIALENPKLATAALHPG